jgi:hypothetical protein
MNLKPYDEQDDEIIKEVRQARQRVFEDAGGTLDGLFKMLKALEKNETLPVVNLPPRKLSPSDAARTS